MNHHLRIYRAALLFVFLLASCGASPPEIVAWRGYQFRELRTLAELPKSVQDYLGVGRPAWDGIADRGGKFNATDLVDSNLPMRRFAVAGTSDDAALIAIENGGFAYNVEVLLFENVKQPVAKKISTLFQPPNSLRELVQGIDASGNRKP